MGAVLLLLLFFRDHDASKFHTHALTMGKVFRIDFHMRPMRYRPMLSALTFKKYGTHQCQNPKGSTSVGRLSKESWAIRLSAVLRQYARQ